VGEGSPSRVPLFLQASSLQQGDFGYGIAEACPFPRSQVISMLGSKHGYTLPACSVPSIPGSLIVAPIGLALVTGSTHPHVLDMGCLVKRGNKTWQEQVRVLGQSLFHRHNEPCLPSQVQHQALRDCLIKHTILIRGEFVTRPLNIAQAADRRDAFVKVEQRLLGRSQLFWSTTQWLWTSHLVWPGFLVFKSG
jgi:hypothetical protein